jgi:hypothetical protein
MDRSKRQDGLASDRDHSWRGLLVTSLTMRLINGFLKVDADLDPAGQHI